MDKNEYYSICVSQQTKVKKEVSVLSWTLLREVWANIGNLVESRDLKALVLF